jgi:HEAT repeat protein
MTERVIHFTQSDIDRLVRELENKNPTTRARARLILVQIGRPAVPALIRALSHYETYVRCEAAHALGDIGDPTAIPKLVRLLEDEDVAARWRATVALTAIGTPAVIPLLLALVDRFESVRLREGVRRVIQNLKDRGELPQPVVDVLNSLGDIAAGVESPWVAITALEAMGVRNYEPRGKGPQPAQS